MSNGQRIEVAAGVIAQGERCLMTRRPQGSHMAGYWEFPGGKLEAGESASEALVRELQEELAVGIDRPTPLWRIEHSYPGKHVVLHFLAARIVSGTPRPLAADALGWYAVDEMPALPILPADLEILERLADWLRAGVKRD